MSKKIKVLHVIKTFKLGGAETNLLNLVSCTDFDKYEIHIAYAFGGEVEGRLTDYPQMKIYKYDAGDPNVKSWASLRIIWKLALYILKNGIHIVHTHNFNACVWGGAAAKVTFRKSVEHVHDFRYLEPAEFARRKGGVIKQYNYSKYLRHLSDAVIVLTRQNRDFLLSRRWKKEKEVYEIKNGIRLLPKETASKRSRQSLGLPDSAKIILTAARLDPSKNLERIVQTAALLCKKNSDVVFMIAGTGDSRDALVRMAQEYRVEKNVRLIGYVDDIRGMLSLTDIFLLPSYLELHSIAILEAMSLAVPIVVSEGVGCHNEFIRNWENGVLLDPFGDAAVWADALDKLLRAPELSKRIGENGYATCRDQFSLEKTVAAIDGVYADLMRR